MRVSGGGLQANGRSSFRQACASHGRDDGLLSGTLQDAGLNAESVALPVEIERKFLVASDAWRAQPGRGRHIRQGYIIGTDQVSVRVRIVDDAICTLTTKLPRCGMSRFEFENDLMPSEARALIGACEGAVIDKIRYEVMAGADLWEIDVFRGDNEGLVVAEIELRREDQEFIRPSWLGREVTGIARYQNSSLAKRPWTLWPKQPGEVRAEASYRAGGAA